MVIAPAKLQLRMQGAVRRGIPPKTAVGDPGDQGPAGVGVQGMGVKAPMAAAVAPATAGLARLSQTPKGRTFKNGVMFIMVPICVPPDAMGEGRNIREAGAAPMEQADMAPDTTTDTAIDCLFLQA
jgi:hypothetical protein